jgi:hypothetical protein
VPSRSASPSVMALSVIAICEAWAARSCGSARASFIRRSQPPGAAAELTQLVGDLLGVADHNQTQHIQDRLAGGVMRDALAQRVDPARVRTEQHGLLGREVVEERARRHVRRLSDVVDGDVRETALGDQVKRHPAQRPAGGQLLALAQRCARAG